MNINKGRELIRTMYREYLSLRKERDYLPLVPTCENLVLQTCFSKEIDKHLGTGYESLSDLERINLFFLYTDLVVTHSGAILGVLFRNGFSGAVILLRYRVNAL